MSKVNSNDIKVATKECGDDGLCDPGFQSESYGGIRDQVAKSNDQIPTTGEYFDQVRNDFVVC